jgi:hypothetical protein
MLCLALLQGKRRHCGPSIASLFFEKGIPEPGDFLSEVRSNEIIGRHSLAAPISGGDSGGENQQLVFNHQLQLATSHPQ